nr:histidine phosphatase family protein [Nocardioides flavescens]
MLRHGRTAWNHAGRIQGHLEVPLDEIGLAQAERTAPVLAALGPSIVWCSDLARTRQTVAPLGATTGLEPRFDPRLREFGFGEREGLTHAEFRSAHPEEFARFREGEYDAVPTAERTSAVAARMHEALTELLATLEPGQTGIAVSHGAAVRVAVGALLGWPDRLFHTLRGLDNCGWVVLREHPEHGGLRLEAYNRVVPETPAVAG